MCLKGISRLRAGEPNGHGKYFRRSSTTWGVARLIRALKKRDALVPGFSRLEKTFFNRSVEKFVQKET